MENKELNTMEKQILPNEKLLKLFARLGLISFGLVLLSGLLNFFNVEYTNVFFYFAAFTGFFYFYEKKFLISYLPKDKNGEIKRPWWLGWTSEIFLVVLVISLVRGFLLEITTIPTGSMIPTIMIGDKAFVNKSYYDIKIPIIEKAIYRRNEVARGDIAVFRNPVDPSILYIKRLVAIPGDMIEYDFVTRNLVINEQEIKKTYNGEVNRYGKQVSSYTEDLFGVQHYVDLMNLGEVVIPNNPNKENCSINGHVLICKIPQDAYFAIGDNRDNSLDSRFWGFVPRGNILGKAIL